MSWELESNSGPLIFKIPVQSISALSFHLPLNILKKDTETEQSMVTHDFKQGPGDRGRRTHLKTEMNSCSSRARCSMPSLPQHVRVPGRPGLHENLCKVKRRELEMHLENSKTVKCARPLKGFRARSTEITCTKFWIETSKKGIK